MIRPQVQFVSPLTIDDFAVMAGDSVFAQVRVSDDIGVAKLEVEGYALRGDPTAGTQVKVARFVTRSVNFTTANAPRDTLIAQFLRSTGETLAESPVFLVATAQDAAGNVDADTVRIRIVTTN